MGAGARVAQEDADFFRHFRREGVFNLRGMLIERLLLHPKGLIKEAFSQAVAAQDVARTRFAARFEGELCPLEPHPAFPRHQHEGGAMASELREVARLDYRVPRVFLGMPDRLQQVVNEVLLDCFEYRNLRQAAVVELLRSFGYSRIEGQPGDAPHHVVAYKH